MNDLRHIHDEGLSPAAHAALAALRTDEGEMPGAARERVWTRLAQAPIAAVPAPGRALWRGAVVGLAIAAGLALALVELGRGAQPIARAPRGEAARYDGAAPVDVRAASPGVGAAREAGAATGVAVLGDRSGADVLGDRSGSDVPGDRSGVAVLGDRSGVAVPGDRSVADVLGDRSVWIGERAGRKGAEVAERPGEAPGAEARGDGGAPAPGEGDADAGGGDAGTLAAEAALLQRAQTALAAGDPEAALARLGEHARGFKDGVLARERDALRVTALCAAGRTAEGRAEGAAFLAAHPGSLLAERVRGACEP